MSARQGDQGIAVVGHGVVSAPPDVMTLVLGVSVQRDSVGTARSDAARLSAAVIGALRGAGVGEHDLQTARFGVQPEYRHTDRRRILDGYRVTSTLQVTVRDLDRAGDVVDAAIAAGGNDVVLEHVAFRIEDDSEQRNEARGRAWDDAHRKAQQLADLAGVTLGTAERVAEVAAGVDPYPVARVMAAESATPIEAGASDIAVTLDVRFTIASP